MQPRHQPGGALALFLVLAIEIAELLPGRIMLQDRRTDALHAATFLIDQDRRVPADAIAHLGNQIADLRRLRNIASEEDEAPGALGLIEGLLIWSEGKAAAAQ